MSRLRPLIALVALGTSLSAQAMTATFVGGALSIKGSAGVDQLTITTAPPTEGGDLDPPNVYLVPGGDTTVNGSFAAAAFENVLSLKVSLGGESDTLDITQFFGLIVPVAVNAGAGDDHVELSLTGAASLKFVGGAGEDTLGLNGCELGAVKLTDTSGPFVMAATSSECETLTLKSGSADDGLACLDLSIAGDLVMSLGSGDDVPFLSQLTVGGSTSVKLGPGSDNLTVDESLFGGAFTVVGGVDPDFLDFADSSLGASLDVKLGSGPNGFELTNDDLPMQVAGSVTVTGGPDRDTVLLREESPDESVAIGLDLVLTLKSGENELEQSGDVIIARDLLVKAGALGESLQFDGLTVARDASFLLGLGTNLLALLNAAIGNDLTVVTGDDDDTLQLTGTSVGGEQTIDLGGGES